MVYQPHFLLQFGGFLGAPGVEIWSCGIRLRTSGADPFEDMDPEQYLDDTAVPALSSWFSSSGTGISNSAKLTFAKCNGINAAGNYEDPQNPHERFFGPVGGSSGGDVMPYQVSLCYTWETNAASRGPGSRGRIYIPLPVGGIVGSTGLLSPGQQTAHANAAAGLINSLDAALGQVFGGTVRPCISTDIGAGANNQIDRVSVDSRYDTQRRRAGSLKGARSAVDVNY